MLFINRNKNSYHRFQLDRIPDELVLSILTFCQVSQVIKFSYMSHHYYDLVNDMSQESSNFLWKQLCLNYSLESIKSLSTSANNNTNNDNDNNSNNNSNDSSSSSEDHIPSSSSSAAAADHIVDSFEAELREEKRRLKELSSEMKLSESVENWKEQYKLNSTYVWDPISCNRSRHLIYTNNNRTVENPKDEPKASYWATTRSQKVLRAGYCYRWEVELNKFSRDPHNTWWILVGVETPDFPFQTQGGNDVLAYQSVHHGIAYIVGTSRVNHRGERSTDAAPFELKQGDIIGIVFDMTQSSVESEVILTKKYETNPVFWKQKHECGAKMDFFLIRDGKRTHLTNVTVNNVRGLEFYPAVSLNQNMQTTIRPATWL